MLRMMPQVIASVVAACLLFPMFAVRAAPSHSSTVLAQLPITNNNANGLIESPKNIGALYWPYTFGDGDFVQYIDLVDDDDLSEADRSKRFEASSMPGVLRFGKRGQVALIDDLSNFDGAGILIKKEMPGVLRFGKRSVPGVLRFGKRDDIPGVLRFGKRNVPGVLRFGRK